jgi:hypothetical protein
MDTKDINRPYVLSFFNLCYGPFVDMKFSSSQFYSIRIRVKTFPKILKNNAYTVILKQPQQSTALLYFLILINFNFLSLLIIHFGFL